MRAASCVTPTFDTLVIQPIVLWVESQTLIFIDNTWALFMTPKWDLGWYQRFYGWGCKTSANFADNTWIFNFMTPHVTPRCDMVNGFRERSWTLLNFCRFRTWAKLDFTTLRINF